MEKKRKSGRRQGSNANRDRRSRQNAKISLPLRFRMLIVFFFRFVSFLFLRWFFHEKMNIFTLIWIYFVWPNKYVTRNKYRAMRLILIRIRAWNGIFVENSKTARNMKELPTIGELKRCKDRKGKQQSFRWRRRKFHAVYDRKVLAARMIYFSPLSRHKAIILNSNSLAIEKEESTMFANP